MRARGLVFYDLSIDDIYVAFLLVKDLVALEVVCICIHIDACLGGVVHRGVGVVKIQGEDGAAEVEVVYHGFWHVALVGIDGGAGILREAWLA